MHNKHLLSDALGRMRFADALIDYLVKQHVEYIFGMPAESVNSLAHAAACRPEMRVVTTRHESAAALMAVEYARSSGRLGVCFGSAGPGATNLLTGTYEAFVARVPLLAITGQVRLADVGLNSFQEIDSEALFKACVSSSSQINAADQFERFVRSCTLAVHEATACHLAIPGDVLAGPVGAEAAKFCVPSLPTLSVASKEEISLIVDFLESDSLAIVFSGYGGRCQQPVMELSEHLGCDVYAVPEPAGAHVDFSRTSLRPLANGVIPARDVLIVGRSSPLLKKHLLKHANLLEITDRRLTGNFMPYSAQVMCDVEATLLAVLATLEDHSCPLLDQAITPECASEYPIDDADDCRVFTDVGRVGDVLSGTVLSQASAPVSSVVGIPGAALPLGIGAAFARGPGSRSVVVTDYSHLSQFVADLSTLVGFGRNVAVVCLVDGGSPRVEIEDLGAAFSLKATAATTLDELSGLLGTWTANPDPMIIALPRDVFPLAEMPAPRLSGHSLAESLTNNLGAPVQISEFCKSTLLGFEAMQATVNAQAPSMSASALRKSGRAPVGVVAATVPALLLQLNGIYDAAMDGAKILVVTVEADDWLVDSSRILEEVSATRYTVDDPLTAAEMMRRACVAASSPGAGVVHVKVVRSALGDVWDDDGSAGGLDGPGGRLRLPEAPAPDEDSVLRAVAALQNATHPTIIAGGGAGGCAELLTELANLLNCPVHLTMGGDSALDQPALRAGGRVGASGDVRAFRNVSDADVLLLVGVSNRGSAFNMNARGLKIALNVDPGTMVGLAARDIGILADAKRTLESMLNRLRTCDGVQTRVGAAEKNSSRLRRVASRIVARRAASEPLRASSLTKAINEELSLFDGTSTVCADVGVNTLWVYRYITSMTRSIWSGSFATMGFAIPAAIAVARNSSEPELVVAVSGDGGACVTLSQLRSSVEITSPTVFVVLNNLALAAIKFESQIMGWPDTCSAIPDINFSRYGTSIGIPSRRVHNLSDFRVAFKEAIESRSPFLIDARCTVNDAPVQAEKRHWRQVVGFVLAWFREGRTAIDTFLEVLKAYAKGKIRERAVL